MKVINNILIEISDKDIKNGELNLDKIEELSESIFENNEALIKVNAPDLKTINNRAFYGCVNLKEINAPNLISIGDYAFYNCTLKEFDFSNVLEIGKNTFECAQLENVFLPKTLKKIGKYAFANNPYLVKVELMSLMTKLKDGMFENCVNLKEISFSNTINKFGIGVFKNCKKLNQVIMPEHLKVIETNAFWGCEGLKKVDFNDELEVINDYAFGDTRIENVVLPVKVKTIGKFPFHMCYHLEKISISRLFHDSMLDKTNSKLKELTIGQEKIEIPKPLKRVINYNKLIVIKYNDDSFHIFSKPLKYYNQEYFFEKFPKSNIKLLMKSDEILNIFYWESILGESKLKEINPIAIVALPPNINTIKAFYNKRSLYDSIISKYEVTEFNNLLALIKFITVFGGLCKKGIYNINSLIEKIGMRNLTKQFLDIRVKEFNQKFIKLYVKLSENYSYKEINSVMPFLYNDIDKVTNLENNYTLDTLETLKFESDNNENEVNIDVVKSENKTPNYEWLDTTKTTKILWGYILASASDKNIDLNEETRKVSTYYIKDDQKMIVAQARAYYSTEEKYLLFNSIILSQSFINKGYNVEKVKSLIIDYVLASIEDVLNFLNEKDPIVTKVRVSLSEKNIKEQLQNRGTKIISQNF